MEEESTVYRYGRERRTVCVCEIVEIKRDEIEKLELTTFKFR